MRLHDINHNVEPLILLYNTINVLKSVLEMVSRRNSSSIFIQPPRKTLSTIENIIQRTVKCNFDKALVYQEELYVQSNMK